MAPASMTVLGVKSLHHDQAILLDWCRTMDLLLVLHQTPSVSSDIVIHRLNWTKLPFSASSLEGKKKQLAPIRAVAWSPDGKSVVAGFHDGVIRVFEVESSDLVQELLPVTETPTPVIAVSWCAEKQGHEKVLLLYSVPFCSDSFACLHS